jgi:hypothetical protein
MAEAFSNEGLDLIQGIFPKGGTNLTTTYVLLWTGPGTASTVTAAMQTSVLSTYTGIAEVPIGTAGYARQSIAAASWGAMAAGAGAAAGGRQTTAGQVSFPAATAAYGTAINGFGLANVAAHSGDVGIFYANFDDVTAIASLALGDIVKVTPTFGLTP